jgi:uncharacterized surface protein with fasciclin (FAS1) repeats
VTSSSRARGAAVSAVAALAVTLTACTSDAPGSSAGATSSSAAAPVTTVAALPADRPFGPGCVVPADGPASFAGMAAAPVVTALSANPVFSALVQSATQANLVDSLNSQQDVTVLAPADEAFQAVPGDQLAALGDDVPRLTAVLTHHVVSGRLTPAEFAGEHTTVNDDTVTVEHSGETFTIPGDQTLTGQPATVLCGNVQTANATVYVIDQVLEPHNAG